MSRSAGTRLSAHPIHKKSGFCPLASLAKYSGVSALIDSDHFELFSKSCLISGILLPLNNCQQYTQCYKFKLI
ncbi:Uncharacterised protein [Vibrio cholerae]|nr:Uncharacterised protein [Vibrio cholerae]CSD18541.1 Uncharacterised protein [Vibrio cholerae]